MKTFTFLYFAFFFQHVSFAQQMTQTDEHVNIKALMSKFSYDQLYSFNIDIYKQANKMKIVYSVLDSFTAKNMFQTFLDVADTATTPRFFLNIDSIATQKKLYQKDSLEFNSTTNKEYSTLIDSCFLQNAHQFDNLLPPDYVHVDGVPYRFTFEHNKKIIKIVRAISPTNHDYPFLTRLIKVTFSLYQSYQSNDNPLINKANTNGRYYR
jgi:hypothetical protein